MREESQRLKLAEGIYLVEIKRWASADFFDRNADLPDAVQLLEPHHSVLSPPDWTRNASCLDLDEAIWFGTSDDREPRGHDRALALAICEQCPVRSDCLAFAMANKIKFGIWGGTDTRQRANLAYRLRFDPGTVSTFLEEEYKTAKLEQSVSQAASLFDTPGFGQGILE